MECLQTLNVEFDTLAEYEDFFRADRNGSEVFRDIIHMADTVKTA